MLKRLKIWQKFTLIAVAFSIPIVVLTYFLILEQGKQIAFTSAERDGSDYLRPLRKLVVDVSAHRDLANGVLAGGESLKADLDKKAAEIDADFKAWVRLLPAVPEEIKPGMASLGVEIEAGSGDGPVVVSVPRRKDGVKVDLKPSDVITAIDGKPVREMAELVRVLGGYEPGTTVEVSYRRFKLSGTSKVTLIRK